jgi:hypothetical protein
MAFSSRDVFKIRKELKEEQLSGWLNEDKLTNYLTTSTGLVHFSNPNIREERPKHTRLKCCEHCGANTNKGEKCQYCGCYYKDVR